MLLQFPDADTLCLAIRSGRIPEATVTAPMELAADADASLWIQADGSVPAALSATLKSWGVTVHRGKGPKHLMFSSRKSWLQAVPLRRDSQFGHVGDRTQVLFEFSEESLFPELVNEILRQGNDRQSFRKVDAGGKTVILLRVIGAPLYSILRSADTSTGERRVRAYIERQPRIWTEAGWLHPLASGIAPSPGQNLLISADGDWTALKEEPFQDVYSIMEFALPEAAEALQNRGDVARLKVPLRLARSSGTDDAEVFVLTSDAIGQLDRFVQASSDQVLERLAFAVAETTDSNNPTVVIRIRPGRSAPPILVFDGLPCRTFLKIPNLFVPKGLRLHPPLRRDAIRALLASDDSRLVWLAPVPQSTRVETSANGTDRTALPVTEHDATSFVVRSIPDSAFLPLSSWVDYILDRDQEVLTAWRRSHQFEFDDFICRTETSLPQKAEAKAEKKTRRSKDEKASSDTSAPSTQESGKSMLERFIGRFRRNQTEAEDPEMVALRQRLAEVEQRFVDMDVPLEDSGRAGLWNEMAELNADLARFADASICRQHQFWEEDSIQPELVEHWFRIDVLGAKRLGGLGLLDPNDQVSAKELKSLCRSTAPSPAESAQAASWIVWASATEQGQKLIREQMPDLVKFLERQESALSVRACWMAWTTLARLNHDVLMLARARDRILERMYDHGLVADRDMPSFLRTGIGQSGERIRQVREKVRELHESVREWSITNLGIASDTTLHYIDLTFAFAFAKLGESSVATELIHSADQALVPRSAPGTKKRNIDPIHRWLFEAYRHRIESVSNGTPLSSPFPAKMMERLEQMDRLDRYKVDRLRQHSSILEPVEKLDPYREWRRRSENDLQKILADLFVENDRTALAAKINGLLERKLSPSDRAQVVTTALELSTRLGEGFARGLLTILPALEKQLNDPIQKAQLLEKGLQIGAHYDQTAAVQDCFTGMTRLLSSLSSADVTILEALESLLTHSFRSLRKLGMKNEISFLLDAMSKIVRESRKGAATDTERLRILLQMAGAWFYFGQDRGWKDIDVARDLLLGGALVKEGHVGAKKQTDLAISYITAVGQAPLHEATERLQDLFKNLTGVRDGQTVSSHYSLKQLDIVEALVHTIISDGFTMDRNSQRWLDDEEFLIRRRIHRDVRKLME